MSSSITHSTGTLTPELIDGYEAIRPTHTVVHDILNRPNPDITFRAPGLRRGQFRCLFPEQADALSAFAVLSIPQVFAITDPEVDAIDMSFIVGEGDLSITLDEDTRDVWWITIPFVEVSP
ncbi:hypothetical protein AB0P00_17645 [Microbacterium sp. NPDC077057]|uniref:hypothetical protein n=1 Tax=Microbacterium sp. NPDC077057 TaxID=3154763 RepID=UPI0034459132